MKKNNFLLKMFRIFVVFLTSSLILNSCIREDLNRNDTYSSNPENNKINSVKKKTAFQKQKSPTTYVQHRPWGKLYIFLTPSIGSHDAMPSGQPRRTLSFSICDTLCVLSFTHPGTVSPVA